MVSAMLRWYLGLKEIRQFIKKKKSYIFLYMQTEGDMKFVPITPVMLKSLVLPNNNDVHYFTCWNYICLGRTQAYYSGLKT